MDRIWSFSRRIIRPLAGLSGKSQSLAGLGVFLLFMKFYERLLRFFLAYKLVFYTLPAGCVLFGLTVWLGFDTVFGLMPATA